MFEIGDYIEFQSLGKTIIGFILGFYQSSDHVLIQITKGGNFGHDGNNGLWYQKDRKTIIEYKDGKNRYWVPESDLLKRDTKIYYEVY